MMALGFALILAVIAWELINIRKVLEDINETLKKINETKNT